MVFRTDCVWRIVFAEIIILPCFRSRAVILGANVAGTLLAKELQQVARSRIMLLGYIHEGSDERQEADSVPLLGGKAIQSACPKDNFRSALSEQKRSRLPNSPACARNSNHFSSNV